MNFRRSKIDSIALSKKCDTVWYSLPHLLYKAIVEIASSPFFSTSFFFIFIYFLATSQEKYKWVEATTERKELREKKNCISDFCE
jgi:hypothetical protein